MMNTPGLNIFVNTFNCIARRPTIYKDVIVHMISTDFKFRKCPSSRYMLNSFCIQVDDPCLYDLPKFPLIALQTPRYALAIACLPS